MVDRSHRARRRRLLSLAVLLGLPVEAAAQTVIASVVPPGSPAVRLATFDEPGGLPLEGAVQVRTANVLFCHEPGATLLLARDQSNEVTVACPFTLMVVLDDERLVVSLEEGEVYVESERPTGVSAGDAMIGTGHTHYAVRLGAEEDGEELVSCSVFEGDVVAQVPSGTLAIEQGKAWTATRRELASPAGEWAVVREVSSTELSRAAALYTSVAVEMTRASGAEVAADDASRLREGYLGVLREPAKPEARVRLKEAQVRGRFSVPVSALEVVSPEALERDPNLSARLLSAEAVRVFGSGEADRALDLVRLGGAPTAAVIETLRTYEEGNEAVAGAARRLRSRLGVAPP